MSLADFSDELIAHVCNYLDYSDICTLMETSKNNFVAIKKHEKEKIKLSRIRFERDDSFNMEALDDDWKKYEFKGFNKNDEDFKNIQRVLEKTESVDLVCFSGNTSKVFTAFMDTRCKIGRVEVSSDSMSLSVANMVALGSKYNTTYIHNHLYSAIWNDEVFIQLLPNSTLIRTGGSILDGVRNITDKTLDALIGKNEVQTSFGISGVRNSITVKRIADTIKRLQERNIEGLNWNLGILEKDQNDDAKLHFGTNGDYQRKTKQIHEILEPRTDENVYNSQKNLDYQLVLILFKGSRSSMSAGISANRRWIEYICESIFPFQAFIGIVGSVGNLLVLFSRPMRSRTNTILAFASISDILFLMAMIPNNMSRRSYFVYTDCEEGDFPPRPNDTRCYTQFTYFYMSTKAHFAFLMNWFSAASTWLMVGVSFDRFWAIKNPFSAWRHGCSLRECLFIPTAFVLTFVSNFHMNLTFSGEQPAMIELAHFFTILNLFTQVLIPMVLLIGFNVFLLHYLRNRRQFFEGRNDAVRTYSNDESPSLLSDIDNQRKSTVISMMASNTSTGSTVVRQLSKAERHVTVTVVLILSAFVLTHLPSAILYTKMYFFHLDTILTDRSWYTWIVVCSALATTGKMANFPLFCLTSRHFRSQFYKRFCSCWSCCFRKKSDKNSQTPKTRSVPLHQIGDSASNVP